jgi:UMP-CMP kinase
LGEPRLVLFFQCPQELAKARVLVRKDGRAGDNSEVFDKRYKEYLTNNPAILDYYGTTRGNGKLIEVSKPCQYCPEFC